MGARATLVGALVVEGRLWGLVSCQQKNEPKYFRPAEMDALAWLCEDIALLIEARLLRERRDYEQILAARRRTFLDAVRVATLHEFLRSDNNTDLLGVVGADGFALSVDGVIKTTGSTPAVASIRSLLDQRRKREPSQVFATSALISDFALDDVGDEIAGALFVSALQKQTVTMIWFRRERHCSVHWGGDPAHPHFADQSGRMSPRKSFDLFLQDVLGQSLPWTPEELDSATELGSLIEIEALRESEARLHSMFLSMAEGLVLQQKNGRIIDANPSAETILGLNHEQLLGRTSIDPRWHAIQEDGTPLPGEFHPAMLTLKTGNALRNQVMGIQVPDHDLRWISVNSEPIFDSDRTLPEAVVTTFIDITERKRLEHKLFAALREKQTILDNDLIGIMTSKDRTIVWANPAFEQMMGYPPGELNGTPTRNGYPSDDAYADFGKRAYAMLSIGKPFKTRTEYVRKDGQHIWVDVSGSMLNAAAGLTLWCFVDVTEQTRSLELLRESENRFRRFFEMNSSVQLLIDPQSGVIEDANLAAEAYYGYSREQLVGMVISDINTLSPENIAEELLLAKRESRNHFLFQHRLASGEIRDVEVHSTPIESNGRPLLFSLVHDITVSKQKERDLLESQDRLSRAESIAHVGNWSYEVADKSIQWSNELWNIFGRTPQSTELNYETFTSWIREDFRAIHDQKMGEMGALKPGGEVRDFVYCLVRPDGEQRWVEVFLAPEFDDNGVPMRFFGVVQDFTERKQAEAKLANLIKEQQAILENSSVGITLIKDRKQVWANHRMSEMFGYSEEEMENQSIRMFFPSQEAYDKSAIVVYPVLSRGETYRVEQEMLKHDGSLIWMRLSGKAIDPNRALAGSIWVFEDINEQKQLEAALIYARDQAEAANVAKSRFLANMSHEIRTPMNGILGMAQMLLKPKLAEGDRHDYARIVLNSGQTLLTLLNDILDLSKVEAGKIELEAIVFDASQVIHETESLFAQSASRKGLSITSDWKGSADQRYRGDPHRLRQMLSNLVGNAIKFTAQGYIHIEAREIERDDQTASLEFSVTDTGVGIPSDKQALLFQAFTQADSSTTRQFGGAGLGLSIVRALASLMGGEAGVHSEAGKGSRFWLRIRADLVTADQDSRQSKRTGDQEPDSIRIPSSFSGHILAVEDDATNRKVIQVLLGSLGLTVAFAEDGAQAVEAITRGDVADLILMDLQMPIMDGYQATEEIRRWETKNGRGRRPIIALTADAFEEDRQHCLKVGMDDVMTKPIAIDVLRSTLRRWLPAGAEDIDSSAPVVPVSKPMDLPRIEALLRELESLLGHNQFSALGHFKQLQEAVAGTAAAHDLADMEWLIMELRFGQALESLRRIASVHGWEAARP
jgi:PAS domain S-box-containing protein